MGHLGLTPQSVNMVGGWKVQGRTDDVATQLIQDAQDLEKAGIFALVLEMVPADLAKKVTEGLDIPTIGIGAGPDTSGQVLVFQDLLGMNPEFNPTFLRKYADGFSVIKDALNEFTSDVKSGNFPNEQESF
jgi:3-methyl-2-oxobutanoate hydroxymethyltransferase